MRLNISNFDNQYDQFYLYFNPLISYRDLLLFEGYLEKYARRTPKFLIQAKDITGASREPNKMCLKGAKLYEIA